MSRFRYLSFVILLTGLVSPTHADNWPRYRGVDGVGVSHVKGFPTQWTQDDYEWVVELPGEGHSSPVIWEQELFVTTVTDEGRLRFLLCLDALTGKTKWSRSTGFTSNPQFDDNRLGYSTPATDGEQVYVAIADDERLGLAAYDFEGTLLWRNWLGPFLSRHGLATSPIVFEDLVIIPNDQDGPSSILAYDRRDGRLVWSSLQASQEARFATPIMIEPAGKKPQLICPNGIMGISSLDPWSGEFNWRTVESTSRAVASPTYVSGMVSGIQVQDENVARVIVANPLSTGDIKPAHIEFPCDKDASGVLYLIAAKNLIFVWSEKGNVICVDPTTQKVVWQARVSGNFLGSPVCVDGKLYCIEESGKVIVVNAGVEFRLIGENPIGDLSDSTPAVANGQMFLRSFHRLSSLRAHSID